MKRQILKVAILPATGIGDALLMMIASHQLFLAGCEVTTFHNNLPELKSWFPGHIFAPLPTHANLIEILSSFDRIILENHQSPLTTLLRTSFNATTHPKLSLFYPTYSSAKYGPLSSFDQIFLPHLPMADNIQRAVSKLVPFPTTKENGITPPLALVHRLHPKRIVIHPTSRQPEKNWLPARFIALAQKLKNQGFDPIFVVSPPEKAGWLWVEKGGGALLSPNNLSDLAELVYESGYIIGNDSLAGHLASNLKIPFLIIANDPKRMRLWQPGWSSGKCVYPPAWIPNIKGLRWRTSKWQSFISVKKVLKAFNSLR